MVRLRFAALLCLASVGAWGSPVESRELTFEERVAAERSIQRVYYAHQLGATRPFDEAVPRAALERKVRAYLEQSEALRTVWAVPVTPSALRTEMERIARSTRLPDRLVEVYHALGDDPFLVQECLARPALVERLSRERFAFDRSIHRGARRDADELRERLLRDPIDLGAGAEHLRLVDLVRVRGEARRIQFDETPPTREARTMRIELDDEGFARWRERVPVRPGEIGPVVEEEDAFVIRSLVSEQRDRARIAVWTVPKLTWDTWWSQVGPVQDATRAAAVASETVPLPSPRGAAGATSLIDSPVSCAPGNSWDSGSLDTVPEGRDSARAVWTGSLVLVWGGYHSGRVSSGGRYDALIDRWSPMSTSNAPPALDGSTVVWTGSAMLVWGGARCCNVDGYDFWDSQGYRYDPSSDTWTLMSSTNAPQGRQNHVAVWTGQEMLVWGGRLNDLSGYQYPTSGGRYNPSSGTWSAMSTAGSPAGRERGTAIWTGDRMVVWGGTTTDSMAHFVATGGSYDPVSGSWVETSMVDAPQGRADHTAVWTGQYMIVWGGSILDQTGTLTLGTGARYDPALDVWLPMTAAGAPTSRAYHAAVWSGEKMIVWGGFHREPVGGVQYYYTGGRYDPAVDAWTPTSIAGAPSARARHVGVWAGDRLFVWGGSAPGTYFETGGRYDPMFDTWAPTYWPGAPAGRSNPTAVWTGNVVIVWGGVRNEEPLATGGRYDPLTDAWSATSLTGAALGRVFHTAVWSGSEMIVWGGEPPHWPNIYNRGGRYDPVSDSWTPMNYLTAPPIRARHTAVWTGSRMLIWGGESFDSPRMPLDTGALYAPATDSWSLMLTSGAPQPRTAHTAVWTGSHMIVWGGSDLSANQAFYNTGGQYDPAANSWSAVAKGGAPSGRRDHTAVWSGSRMIVWGGNGGTDLNTGGRYDPVGNRWDATSTVNAPTPRIGHTAVWGGTAMVVWGGQPSSFGIDAVATGGRYDPGSDTWTPTTMAGAPAARQDHAAVWTGDFMIVWGGTSPHEHSSGGRYVVTNPDLDADGVADVCDCSPANPTLIAVPGEVTGVRLGADHETLSWNSSAPSGGSATVHDVATGALEDLPVGNGGSAVCLASAIAAASWPDPSMPAPGHGIWYIVRGRNACGIGPYGSASDGTPIQTTACP